jgi:hypothetical protein
MFSACMKNSANDCRRDFNKRGDRVLREEASCEESSHTTRIGRKFVVTKDPITMMKSAKDRVAPIARDDEMERAAIFAPANPLGIITMGTFPLSLIALGHVSRRNFDPLTLRPRKEQTKNSARRSR